MARQAQRAVVIGSGFGGLAAAIRLQAQGLETTLVEKNEQLGGRASCFRYDGYTFDAGPTVVTAPDALRELFDVAGVAMERYVELVEVDPMYRLFWDDGTTMDYMADGERLHEQIRRLNPDDVPGYQRFLRYATQVYEKGYEELCHVPFQSFWDMMKVAPDLLRLQAHRSVYSTVSRYLKNEKLRQAFSFNSLLIGGNPFVVSSIYTLIHPLERKWGVFFPKGGMTALVEALGRLFTDLGGTVLLNQPVTGLKFSGKRVTGVETEGGDVAADVVVSNADVIHTYRQLAAGSSRASYGERLTRKKQSMSLFLMYFGSSQDWPNLTHHNVMFGPRYKGLLTDIFDRGVIAGDPSLYVHAPSKTDASLAPEGKYAYYVLCPVPHMGLGEPVNWQEHQHQLADHIIRRLDASTMPGLASSVESLKLFTPQDFESRLNAYQGSAFSIAPILTQSAWFRVHNRDPELQGLYIVGAGTHPGAGIPGVIGSAKATCGQIVADYGLKARETAAQAVLSGA